MSETRKLAAILCSDVVRYSRLAGADEDRILARLRALRSDLIDPTIAVHNGRVVKRTGDGAIVEFRSVVDAVTLRDRGANRDGRTQCRRHRFVEGAIRSGIPCRVVANSPTEIASQVPCASQPYLLRVATP
jgi:class 3 adenylate cyclase